MADFFTTTYLGIALLTLGQILLLVLPLMVALGAGDRSPATCTHRSSVLGWTVSGYRFG